MSDNEKDRLARSSTRGGSERTATSRRRQGAAREARREKAAGAARPARGPGGGRASGKTTHECRPAAAGAIVVHRHHPGDRPRRAGRDDGRARSSPSKRPGPSRASARREHRRERRLPHRHGAARRRFTVEASPNTLRRTTLGQPGPDTRQPRARAPAWATAWAHIVQGHVDGVGRLGGSRRRRLALYRFRAPAPSPPTGRKGSIAVDGVSLTVFACAARASPWR